MMRIAGINCASLFYGATAKLGEEQLKWEHHCRENLLQ
jgi:hypothetical protein